MQNSRAQEIRNALEPFWALKRALQEHAFHALDFSSMENAIAWKQRALKDIHTVVVSLEGASLSDLARRADEQRLALEKGIDLDAPLALTVRLLDNGDELRKARERRRSELVKVIEGIQHVVELLEEEGQRQARVLEQREQAERERAKEARAEATRAEKRQRQEVAARLDEFSSAASANLDRGCKAAVSGIYFQGSDGIARNLAMSVVLVPAESSLPGHVGPLLSLDGLRAFRGVVPSDKVKCLLDAIRGGAVPADCLPSINVPITLEAVGHPDAREYEQGHRAPSLYQDLAGNVFAVSGKQIAEVLPAEVWNRLPTRLPASNPPFANTAHLSAALDFTTEIVFGASRVSCEVFSPIWVRLGRVEADLGKRKINVEVESFWGELGDDCTITLIPRTTRSSSPSPYPLRPPEWTVKPPSTPGEPHVFSRTFEAPGEVGPVLVSINFRGRQVGRAEVGNVSPRVVAHDTLDPNLAVLKTYLTSSAPEKFEAGVGLVLHLCGLSVGVYGYKDMDRSVDLIAFHGDSFALFVECTLEPPDAKKVKNLSSRAEAFRTLLQENHGRSINLVRTMFVRRPRRAMLTEAVEGALAEKVTIAFEEDLHELLAMALRGESASLAVAHLATVGNVSGPVSL